MPIQKEAAQPVDPLASLESDYGHAVLHLAWDMHKQTGELTLLFGFVELLPAEVPPPVDDRAEDGRFRNEDLREHRVYVCHAVVTARQGVDWYLACRRGQAVLPEDDGTLREPGDERARRLGLARLGEEPPWPSLAFAAEPEEVVPFCPTWHRHPRVHHLIPSADLDLRQLWPREMDRRNVIDFLTESFHFDFADYPAYWGSVHLVAPNPVFRGMRGRRLPASTEQVDQILFRLSPRAGSTVVGLEVDIDEQRTSGTAATARITVTSPLALVTFDHRSGLFRETIRDPRRGLLDSAHTVILESCDGMIVMGDNRKRGVRVPATSRRAAEHYEVHLSSGDGVRVRVAPKREPRVPGADARLSAAVRARKAQDGVRNLRERWFDKDVEEARDVLRGLFLGARREVLIVDAYFAAPELYTFALAVGQVDVPIRILTSAELLKRREETFSKDIEKGAALDFQIQHLTSLKNMNTIVVRVMSGDRPAIHDRFLLVDDSIWLLGSSLNEFGSRGTMMVALSHPELVRDKLRSAWDEAAEIQTWLKKREALPQGEAGEACS